MRPRRPKPAPPTPGFIEPPDAWSRNDRRVATIALLLNFALLLFACGLFSRLTTGGYVHLTWPPKFSMVSLGQLMVDPYISIYRVPQQAVVLALLLAIIVVAPIITAQFYGRLWAMLFLLPMILVAQLPLLAGAMLPAIWLARSQVLGIVNRFLRGVVALPFAVAAMWFSTARTEFIDQGPTERFYLHLPWLAAVMIVIASLLAYWVAARVMKYRVGVGAGILAVLIGLTLFTFLVYVGEDELEFRLLDSEIGLTNPRWPIDEQPPSAQELEHKRQVDLERCAAFLAHFPNSRYVPYVLYLQGRTHDLRYADSDRTWQPYWNVPGEAGAESWRQLSERHADHPLAIVARVRLAQVHLAAGELDRGARLLHEAHARRRAHEPAQTVRNTFGLRTREPAVESLIDHDTRQMLDWLMLVRACAGRSNSCDRAIATYFSLDPRKADYLDRLASLRQDCGPGEFGSYLQLAELLQEPDLGRRIETLRDLIGNWPANSRTLDCAIDKLASLLVKHGSAEAKDEAEGLWRQLLDRDDELIRERACQALDAMGRLNMATRPE